jgi:endonuclease/exonuclease/phosphatase family metal-dependent hydrolase
MNQLKVMSFNLCYPGENSPNSWRERYPVIVDVLSSAKPDLIGTQEGMYGNLQDLARDLSGYRWFGCGRERDNKGEHMAVFYREDVLELLDHGDFWLSETPEVPGSESWNTACPRMVTWGLLRHRSGAEFVFVNTHLDHISQEARENGIRLLANRLEAFGDRPVVLTGDFNEGPSGKVHNLLVHQGGWRDCFMADTANGNHSPGTFHDYHDFEGGGPEQRIDWIMVRGPWTVSAYRKLEDNRNHQYPSDHYPVMAELAGWK